MKREYATVILNMLVAAPQQNVRKTKNPASAMTIAQLAMSILAQGILQNLVVTHEFKKGKKTGKYKVIAGDRRLTALLLLLSQKAINKDYEVPVLIVEDAEDADITALSLTENIQRVQMHMADQCEAFKKLADQGRSVGDIATMFGFADKTVLRCLKLATVSPSLIQLYREDGISSEQLAALALSDSHEEQEYVWGNAQGWQRQPKELRKILTKAEISSTTPLVSYVGIDAYRAAGGAIRTDLFSETEECFLLDAELLSRLAGEKLALVAEPIRVDGWLWVEIQPKLDMQWFHRHTRLNALRRDANDEEQKKIDAITKTIDFLNEKIEELHEAETESDDDLSKAYDELEAAEAELTIVQSTLENWTPEIKAVSGVVLTIEQDGNISVQYGLVRPEDKKRSIAIGHDSVTNAHIGTKKEKGEFSEKLTLNLTTHRTAAIQAVMAGRPDVALVSITHRLAMSEFHLYSCSAVQINASRTTRLNIAPELPETPAGKAMESIRAEWMKKLPETDGDLFSWLLIQPQSEVLALLAFCVANTIDTTDADARNGMGQAAQYVTALGMDMADWWTPTKESYFGHVNKSKALATIEDAVSPVAAAPLQKMKRDELADAAEKLMVGKRWLPSVMRI